LAKIDIFAPQHFRGTYERRRNVSQHHYVAKFRENRFRDVENSVAGKRIKLEYGRYPMWWPPSRI